MRLMSQVLVWVLVVVPVLGWVPPLLVLQDLPDPVQDTQQNFQLNSFLGEWYEVARVTNSPYLRSVLKNTDMHTMELVEESGLLQVKITVPWQGMCREYQQTYDITHPPGRFYFGLRKEDVSVVDTNYKDYAVVIHRMLLPDQFVITVLLYSRTLEVTESMLQHYNSLIGRMQLHDMDVEKIPQRGKCVLRNPATALLGPRNRRDTVNITAEEDGSGFDMPVFIDPAACHSEPDSGPCFGMQVRYFYNSSSMSCQEFQYGGCMGNQNNFLTERECLQRCRTEAACRLPMVVEACAGQPPVWVFDARVGGCVAYKPGFCQRNGNKFYSQAECDEYCGVVTDEAEFLKTN